MTLRHARLEMGLSVSEMAKRYGVSISSVRRWDTGKQPSMKSIHKIIRSWPAKIQYEFFSYLFAGPWKETAKSLQGAPMCKNVLEILKNNMHVDENKLKQAA